VGKTSEGKREGRGGGEGWGLLQYQWEGVRGVKCQEEGGTEASWGC